MAQKEAIIEALKRLGGKAKMCDICTFAQTIGNFSGSQKPDSTIRNCIYTHPYDFVKSKENGYWELASYQEELATRDHRIKELEAEVETLKNIPKEDDFVKRFVEETKRFYKHERKKADAIRQIMIKVGRKDAETEIDSWMDGKQKKVVKKIVQNISDSQVFNGNITDSEFNGGDTEHE